MDVGEFFFGTALRVPWFWVDPKNEIGSPYFLFPIIPYDGIGTAIKTLRDAVYWENSCNSAQ